MHTNKANERVFQGELYRIIHKIIDENPEIGFEKVIQEMQVGIGKQSRFADGILFSRIDSSKRVFIELKNNSWDATDETLIKDAANKASNNGIKYFITGTPRQLALYETFVENKPLADRKLKIYPLSNIKKDDEVLLPSYEKIIYQPLKNFLFELSDLVHGIKEVHWDSIDRLFVLKLSSYILEASASMWTPMYERISNDKPFQSKIRAYLTEQDIFNVSVNFTEHDVYNLCQLANYLLYLKIMFYSYIQREVKQLNLKPLEIPLDKDLLNKALRARFNDVLEHDFELIFTETVLDEFLFEDNYLPYFKQNVEEIRTLNFKELSTDIVGSIYNTLIDNQEQHDRGQHFTNTHEVDIVNAFCIKPNSNYVVDTSCGAGTFLVRAYHLMKHFDKNQSHEMLLERLWGVEIAAFPTFLATMNLCLQDVKVYDNYPKIIHSDFSEIRLNFTYQGFHLNKTKGLQVSNISGKKADVKFPEFDTCVGNPPYIRQELIGDEGKITWNKLANFEHNIKKINQQSDLYVYYLMHTAAFLKEGGRLGYVIASSWLDVSFGRDLQDFLLKNFKIIAILDNQSIRSFGTASINTVILILEKCSNREEREGNEVKFVRIFSDYVNFLGQNSETDHFEKVINFVNHIENFQTSNLPNASIQIAKINQKDLENESTFEGKYGNGHWGAKHLRSPKIYQTLIEKAGSKLLMLNKIVEVKYGIKTGANDFFYLEDHTEKAIQMTGNEYLMAFGKHKVVGKKTWDKFGWYYSELTKQHHIIEKFYVKPIFKSSREAKNLEVNISQLKFMVLMCGENKDFLFRTKSKVLDYINEAEKRGVNAGESVQSRNLWYDLSSSAVVGDFIFPSKIGEKYRLIDNQNTLVYCDKVNYAIAVNKEYEKQKDLVLLLLNSLAFRFLIDLFSRQLTGAQTLSDVDVNVVEHTLIPNPNIYSKQEIETIIKAGESLKNREQLPIQEEIQQKDRQILELLILQPLGLNELEINELMFQTAKYVQDRKEKSESVITTKTKGKLNYDDALKVTKERFPEVQNYMEMLVGLATQKFIIPDWQAKFPKNETGGLGNLFQSYKVFFKQGNTQKTLDFAHQPQLWLFEWFYKTLDIKGTEIYLPTDEETCKEILQVLSIDFENYFIQIRNFLKLNRSTANPISIYRDLLMG